MRLRFQRRIRKRLRSLRGHEKGVPIAVTRLEQQGYPLLKALRAVLLDPALSHYDRGRAGTLLALAGDGDAVEALLELFFAQSEKTELYVTALTLEALNDRRAVPTLVRTLLGDANPHRRHASARALGWIRPSDRGTARALAQCLVDPNQPQPAREEAAESLAYVGTLETVDSLIAMLRDPDVRLRFWSVFGLGSSCRGDARAVQALEAVLDDGETPPGNWWPVGKEALAMLGTMPSLPREGYRAKMEAEAMRILSDPPANDDDRRWAGFYGSSRSAEQASFVEY